jgi:hypothetical protein
MKNLIGMVLLTAALAAVNAQTARAAVTTDSGGFGFPLSPGSQVVTLNKFNPALGTLTGVGLSINGTIQANITAENDSAIGGNMGVNLTGLLNAAAPGVNPVTGILQSAGPVTVSPSDGVPDSGPDFYNFGLLSGTNTSSAIAGSLAPYIGPGTFNATVNGSGGFSVNGVTSSTIKVSNFEAFGNVTVIYTYVAIPEPGSLAFISVGLVGVIGARKRRRSNG